MRSQSYQRYVPIAAARPPAAAGAGRTIPAALYWLLALAVGTSFYVAVEPAPTDVLFLVLFVAVLMVRRLRFPLDLNPLIGVGMLLFVAASVLSLLWSEDMDRGIFYLSVTLYLLATWYVVVVLLANYGQQAWDLILRAFLTAAVIVALIGFTTHFTPVLQDHLGVQPAFGERSRGTFKDPNVYAPFLTAALLLVLNRMITSGFSLFRVALFCLFSLEILAAFSRGGYVNLVAALGMFFALQLFIVRRKDWMLRSVIALGLGMIVVAPLAFLFLHITGLDDFLAARLQIQHYDSQRFGSQELAISMVGEAPLGIGPGQSDLLLPISPHNLYLRVAIENGIAAAIGFYTVLAVTLWICLQGVAGRGPFRALYGCCLAILVGMLVNSLVIDSLHWRHLFLFLAVPLGLWQHERWVARAARQPAA
jgi:O-antigen ligase